MLKRFLLFTAVILLLSSGVFATVGNVRCMPIGSSTTISQGGDFSIGASNLVKRIGGAGCAEGGNIVTAGKCQEAQAAGSEAIEKQIGMIVQGAKVSGAGGMTKVKQDASVDALQGQVIEARRFGTTKQGQGQYLDVNLDNNVHKFGGIGRAEGVQGFVGLQHQSEVTPRATNTNTQFVGVLQYANVGGGPCSNIIVNNSVDVNMGQYQNVSVSSAPHKP